MPIEPLRRSHKRQNFNCGEPRLDNFLKIQSLQHGRKNYSDSYVMVEEGSDEVIAYCTVGPSGIDGDLFPDDVNVPRLSLPVVLIGRLATDEKHQGKGIGEEMLMFCLKYALEFSEQYPCYAVVLDALNDDKMRWYSKRGFTSLVDNPRHMYLTIEEIKKLGLV